MADITSENCREVLMEKLCGVPCHLRAQIVSALCQTIISTETTCEEIQACQTITTLSEFTVDGNTVCITYTDENGDEFERCFEAVNEITADNGLSMSSATNVQLGGPVGDPSELLHNTYIDSNGFDLIMSGLRLADDQSIQFLGYGIGTFADTAAYVLGVDVAGNVVETTILADNGLTATSPTHIQLGGTLLHNTTNYTAGFVHTLSGATVYEYPYQFEAAQSFENGTGNASFKHTGSLTVSAADHNNAVRLGINYTGNVYGNDPLPDLLGYMGDKIGYWIGVNGTGHGSFGIYTDDANSKTGGIFFHTLDSDYTDMITIFGKHPTTADSAIAIAGGGTGFEAYRLATFHDDGAVTFYKYGIGTFADTPIYALGVLADGSVIEFTPEEGTTITADNGLSMSTATNVQLGGPVSDPSDLLDDRFIDAHGFTLQITGTVTGFDSVLNVITTGNGVGIDVTSFSGIGLTAGGPVGAKTTGTNIGLWGLSNSGTAVYGQTTNVVGYAGGFDISPTGDDTSVYHAVRIDRNIYQGGATDGIGASIDYYIKTSTNAGVANQLISKWTTSAHASRVSDFVITGVDNTVTSDLVTLNGNGTVNFNHYGSGTITGSENYLLGVTSTGKVVEVDESFFITTVVQNGLSTVDGDGEVVELGSPDLTGAPLLHDTYISGAFNLSLQDGTLTVGTDTPVSATVTTRNESTSDLWSILGVKSNNVSTNANVNIGIEGQMIITGGTDYQQANPIGGMYGELAFLGSGSWSFSGGQNYVQLGGLSGVVTIYTDDASNYTSGNSIFSGGQYFMNVAGSGTIDKFACVRALYPVKTPGLDFSGTITNYYGLYIDDHVDGNNFALITNKWGVYQVGTAEKNQFNGKTNFGTLINLAVFTNSSPADGDVWRADNTNTGLKIRINGVTKTVTVT